MFCSSAPCTRKPAHYIHWPQGATHSLSLRLETWRSTSTETKKREVVLDLQEGPGETKRREVVLDRQESPGEIMSREVELGSKVRYPSLFAVSS